MAKFFIRRPIFAWVIAISIMLAGLLGIFTLSISQYPDIAPTTVRINATYRGASAETVEKSVTTIIEDGLTGLDDLTYMTSTSSTGSASISLTFGTSVDPDIAQVQVQNKLQLVQSQLPDDVIDAGISVTRSTSSILLVGSLVSTDGKRNSVDLGNILSNQIEDQIQRLEGVGSINIFGSGYAMRVWLDPFKLQKYQLTPSDVTSAIEAQNTQVSVGSLGAQPLVEGQQLNVTITAQSQLTTVADFERIILKVEKDGSTVRLSDVSRIEIGQESYGGSSRYMSALERLCRQPRDRRQRHRYRGARSLGARHDRTRPAGRRGDHLSLRHDALRRAVDRKGRPYPHRSDRSRLRGSSCLPAEPARDADPDHRRAGGAAWNLRHSRGNGIFDQHADHVRHGSRNRPPRRRRYRRCRERRAHHVGGKAIAA
ncbi:hypothetical protein AJ87_07375 [Rhizobium yanglingense]|nr:hypothetical protein AJ87_07375 [Rhizobium yanglingense]